MRPELFGWGPVTVLAYPVLILAGMAASLVLLWRLEIRPAGSGHWRRALGANLFPLLLATLTAALLGARLAFLLLYPQYWQVWSPWEMLAFWRGGLVFYGGFLLGTAALWLFCRVRGLPWVQVLDLLAPYFILAYAVGRIGCFLNGCCYGEPAPPGWGVVFPGEEVPRHPTQLYAAGAGLIVFAFLMRLRRARHFPGESFLWLVLLHSVYRFLVELVRATEPVAWSLSSGQWVSLVLALGAGVILIQNYRRMEIGPGGYSEP